MDALIQSNPFGPLALPELHAASLGADGSDMAPAMALALSASFGSAERWRENLGEMKQGHASGFLLLVFQPRDGSLVNQWAENDSDVLADGVPILALEEPEEIRHLNWGAVYQRYQHAVHVASEPFGVDQAEVSGAELLDVRRAGVFEAASQMLPTAHWRDPGQVADWGPALDREREVVVYCVYGHEVGRTTALRLRAQGLKARFLRGGFDAWQSAGLPLVDKGEVVGGDG